MVDVLRGRSWPWQGKRWEGPKVVILVAERRTGGVEGESGGNASRGMQLGRVMMQGRMEQEHQNGMGAGSMKRT
jgi:hypothetical protein